MVAAYRKWRLAKARTNRTWWSADCQTTRFIRMCDYILD